MIDISFKFSKEEFVKGYTSHPELKSRTLLIVILGAAAFVGGLMGLLIFGVEEEKNAMISGAAFFFGFFFLFAGIRQKLNYRKYFDSNPSLQEEINYSFTEKTFKNSGNNFNAETSWDVAY